MEKEKDERPFIELSRKERLAKARKLIFGEFEDEYIGNMWGWKFSLFSFIGLMLVGGFAIYGVYTGQIDLDKLEEEDASGLFQNQNPHLNKPVVPDSLRRRK